ncbi:unnamed protein product, partial [Musa acuminata subsp. burmannicoides]
LPRSLTETAQAVYYKRDNSGPTYNRTTLDRGGSCHCSTQYQKDND